MENKYILDGFYFEDASQFAHAQKESEAVAYIQTKIDLSNPDTMLKLYHRLVLNRSFSTPIGLCFLKMLQEQLKKSGRLGTHKLPAIPVVLSPTKEGAEEVKQDLVREQGKAEPSPTEEQSEQGNAFYAPEGAAEASAEADEEAELARIMEEKERERRLLAEQKRTQRELARYRTRSKRFATATVFLLVAMLALFLITFFFDMSPFADAREAVIDDYVAWEAELDAREAELNAREAALLSDE